jgi:multiple sugar transport system permease protein
MPARRPRPLGRRETIDAWLFIAPALFGIVVFLLVPFLASVYLSLTRYSIVEPPQFVLFQNYRTMISDPSFWKTLGNTAYFAFTGIPLSLAFSLVLALMMNQQLVGRVVFRTAYFIPVVSSWVAVGLVWRWLYNPEFGVVNYALSLIGINGPEWLVSTTWAMPAVIVVNVWKGLGFSMMLYLAALQGVPDVLYEAALIDGANGWQRFWHVTFPMISPTTFFLAVTSVISSFQVFDAIYAMTNGGPEESTKVIMYYLWENAFQFLRMGYAAAMAWVMFLIIFGLTLLQWKLSSRWVFS